MICPAEVWGSRTVPTQSSVLLTPPEETAPRGAETQRGGAARALTLLLFPGATNTAGEVQGLSFSPNETPVLSGQAFSSH